jgi:hypothetical protein
VSGISVDRVRELREQDAWLAGLADRAHSEPAVGAAGTTRFGQRIPNRPAASFRCGECGEIAAVVRVASPRSGSDPGAGSWLALDYFLGTTWHADTGDVLNAVRPLIEQGHTDPVTTREITWTLQDCRTWSAGQRAAVITRS